MKIMTGIPGFFLIAGMCLSMAKGEILAHYLNGEYNTFNHAGNIPGLDPSAGIQLSYYQGAAVNQAYSATNEPIIFPTVPGGSQNYWVLFYDYAMPSDAPRYDASYVEFSIKAEEGMVLNLESLSFDWAAVVQQDITELSRFRFSLFANMGTGWVSLGPSDQQGAVQIGTETGFEIFDPSITFNLDTWIQVYNVNEVTFRIAFANMTENVQESLAISNIRLNGTVVPIPEPSVILSGLSGLFLCLTRRKK